MENTTPEQQEFIVTKFLATTEEFSTLYNQLAAQAQNVAGTPLAKELNALLIDGEKMRATIDGVKIQLDGLLESASETWESITDWFADKVGTKPDPNLGILPIVLGAGLVTSIAGGTYAIDSWLERGQTMTQKIDTFNALKEQGHSTTEAAILANKFLSDQAKKGPLDKAIILGGMALIGLFIWKFK